MYVCVGAWGVFVYVGCVGCVGSVGWVGGVYLCVVGGVCVRVCVCVCVCSNEKGSFFIFHSDN